MDSRTLVSLVVVVIIGCNQAPPADTPTGHSDISKDTLAKVCSGPCVGPLAEIQVWRDAAKGVGRIVLQGDIQSCSAPPTVYFDRAGEVTEQIGMQPVVPGSPEERALTDRRDRQLEGLTEAESLNCP